MIKDIPFKPLNAKQAQDIAKVMCRNDSKRLQDVIDRIGGIDSSAFQLLLDPSDSPHSMMGQEQTSPGLFARTLARSPDQVFDWLVESIADPQSLAWARALDFGATREPSVAKRIFEAQARCPLDIEAKMVRWIDVFRDAQRSAQGARQNAQWAAQREAVDQLCQEFLMRVGAERLAEIRSRLSKYPGAALAPIQTIDTAMAIMEREAIATSARHPDEEALELSQRARKRSL